VAGSTGLEPAASGVTGRRSNQLNYDPAKTFESTARGSPLSSLTAPESAGLRVPKILISPFPEILITCR
jgi:hypothetical protein